MDIKDVTRKPQTKILHQQVALMVEKTFNITDHMLWSAKKNS
jgi:HD superfamily phosphohydrolase YqeK